MVSVFYFFILNWEAIWINFSTHIFRSRKWNEWRGLSELNYLHKLKSQFIHPDFRIRQCVSSWKVEVYKLIYFIFLCYKYLLRTLSKLVIICIFIGVFGFLLSSSYYLKPNSFFFILDLVEEMCTCFLHFSVVGLGLFIW